MNACSSAELFCRTNDRISLGRRLPSSAADTDEPLDVGDDLVVVEPDARLLEDVFAAGVDADVDRVEPRFDHAAGHLLGDQRAVADHADFLDPLLLRVADLLGQVAVEERLAVVVDADVRDAQLRALVDDLLEQLAGSSRPGAGACRRAGRTRTSRCRCSCSRSGRSRAGSASDRARSRAAASGSASPGCEASIRRRAARWP